MPGRYDKGLATPATLAWNGSATHHRPPALSLMQEDYVFAAPAVRDRVNAELASWWDSANSAHSPLLLAWAAVLCLVGRAGGSGGDGGAAADGSFLGHASKANDTGVLLWIYGVHSGATHTCTSRACI